MATIKGTGGSVSGNTGFQGKINAWSATIDSGVADDTGFSDAEFTAACATGFTMTGSFSGNIQYDDSATAPTPTGFTLADYELASLVLTAETGCTYTMAAVITSANVNVTGAQGRAAANGTWNFQSSGSITEAWDETS